MALNAIKINKGQASPIPQLPDTRTSGLIANAVAVADGFQLGTVYKLYGLSDAEALGINAAYDTDNNLVLWYHIKEFYEMVGPDSGVLLYLLGVAQTVTMEDMMDTGNADTVKKLINDAQGQAYQIAAAHNPVRPYTATVTNGLDDDLLAAIPMAQAAANYAYGKMHPTRFLLEGKGVTFPVASLQDLTAIADTSATEVAVVIAQDPDYASLNANFADHAAVGTALGTLASAPVQQNIAWVDGYNLTDTTRQRWVNAGFSNNASIFDHSDDWVTLKNKGYIFPVKYARRSGFRWSYDRTCVAYTEGSDGTIPAYNLRYGRIRDLMALALYDVYVGQVNRDVFVNPNTGKPTKSLLNSFKRDGEAKVLDELADAISGFEVVPDPDSVLIGTDAEFIVTFNFVPKGELTKITGTLNIKNRLED